MARQHTQRVPRSAQNWLQASCPDFITKAENKRQTQGSASGYLGQPATGTDRQGCKRR